MAPTAQMNELMAWRGRDLVGSDGSKIGTITDIYLDEDTGQPEWLAVKTGWFGNRVSFVPLAGATGSGDQLACRWSKDQVKEAPHAEADGRLSQDEEAALYRHYGLQYGESRSDSGLPEGGRAQTTSAETTYDRTDDARGTVGHDTSGPTTDSAMTRSEEEMRVGTQRVSAGQVRLRKWVETEQVRETVPVQREEIRVEREPITDANRGAAMSGPEISSEEHEVSLYEERPVVETEVVPKERIRLDKTVRTEQEQVTGEVRKERIAVEGDEVGLDPDGRGR